MRKRSQLLRLLRCPLLVLLALPSAGFTAQPAPPADAAPAPPKSTSGQPDSATPAPPAAGQPEALAAPEALPPPAAPIAEPQRGAGVFERRRIERQAAANSIAARRLRQLAAPTFAIDIVRILDAVFSVSYGVAISPRLEAGAVLAAGSPERTRLDRFHNTQVGAYASWFGMGNRNRGVGFTARTRYLYAWGEGTSDAGAQIETSAHAFAASGLVMGRYTTLSGLRLEMQAGLMWLSSRATATEGDTTETSKLDVPLNTFSILIGWTF